MTTLPAEAAPAPWPSLLEGRFSGRAEFADLIRLALATAAAQGWREIILCDPDFDDWPLGERAVAQALGDWARSGRRFTMLAGNYRILTARHARFVSWRRTWAHLVACRKVVLSPAESLPSALWSSGWVFERLDVPHCTGMAGAEVTRRTALKERLDEVLLKSSEAFPATTLGL